MGSLMSSFVPSAAEGIPLIPWRLPSGEPNWLQVSARFRALLHTSDSFNPPPPTIDQFHADVDCLLQQSERVPHLGLTIPRAVTFGHYQAPKVEHGLADGSQDMGGS